MMMVSVSLALPIHREGKVKMLSIGSSKRLPQLPEFPTTAESGKLPGYVAGTWFGMAVTGGTPRPIVDKINADVRAVMAEPAFKERFLDQQFAEADGQLAGGVPGLSSATETAELGQGDPRAEARHRRTELTAASAPRRASRAAAQPIEREVPHHRDGEREHEAGPGAERARSRDAP